MQQKRDLEHEMANLWQRNCNSAIELFCGKLAGCNAVYHLFGCLLMDMEHNIIDLAMDVHKEFLKMPIFYIACHFVVTEVSSVGWQQR